MQIDTSTSISQSWQQNHYAAPFLTFRGAEVAEELHEEDAEREADAVGDHVDSEGRRHHHPPATEERRL